MAKFTHVASGVVVEVADGRKLDTAQWKPADTPKRPARKRPAAKAAAPAEEAKEV